MLQKARRAWTRVGTVMGRAAAGGRSLERPFEQSRQSEKVPQIHNVYVTCKKCYRMTIAPNRFMYYLALFFFFFFGTEHTLFVNYKCSKGGTVF